MRAAASSAFSEPSRVVPILPRDETQVNSRYITFGTGLRLLSEDRILSDLESSGIDREGFRALCKALTIPCIHIGGVRYYDFFSFVIALKYVLRWGAQDFWGEGGAPPPDLRDQLATKVNPKTMQEALPDIVEELLAARELAGHGTTISFKEAKKALQQAASRLRSKPKS